MAKVYFIISDSDGNLTELDTGTEMEYDFAKQFYEIGSPIQLEMEGQPDMGCKVTGVKKGLSSRINVSLQLPDHISLRD